MWSSKVNPTLSHHLCTFRNASFFACLAFLAFFPSSTQSLTIHLEWCVAHAKHFPPHPWQHCLDVFSHSSACPRFRCKTKLFLHYRAKARSRAVSSIMNDHPPCSCNHWFYRIESNILTYPESDLGSLMPNVVDFEWQATALWDSRQGPTLALPRDVGD